MNNKGQALVEFVMILPVFLFIALGMIDFGNVLHQKYQLENDLDFIIDLYQEDKQSEINNYTTLKKINVNYDYDGEFVMIELSKRVKITTPGLNLILKEPYYVTVGRHIYEQ